MYLFNKLVIISAISTSVTFSTHALYYGSLFVFNFTFDISYVLLCVNTLKKQRVKTLGVIKVTSLNTTKILTPKAFVLELYRKFYGINGNLVPAYPKEFGYHGCNLNRGAYRGRGL